MRPSRSRDQIHACFMAIFYAAVLLDYAQKTGQKKLAEFCLKHLMILENDTLPSC